MKKSYSILIVLLLVLCISNTKAQDTIKPKLKGWSTELNINPFNGSLSLNNSSGQIKLRKFYANNFALRMAFNIGNKSNTTSNTYAYGNSPIDTKEKMNSLLFAVNFGTEKHFGTNRRLSPYIGWEAGVGFKSSKHVINEHSNTKTIEGAWQTSYLASSSQGYYYATNYTERGYLSLTANALTGFDFYMTKDFYCGYEFGFGIEYFKYSKITVTKDVTFPDQGTYPDQSASSWNIGPHLINGIRIGYTF